MEYPHEGCKVYSQLTKISYLFSCNNFLFFRLFSLTGSRAGRATTKHKHQPTLLLILHLLFILGTAILTPHFVKRASQLFVELKGQVTIYLVLGFLIKVN